ncbi:RnfABCDGE type electron transport complex subunit D [Candidatus Izimaplasma bacterium]|nr:RnfABCDGE type electron transport complex subunit D [Candidatus Izimaplasma bacterium]
MTFKTKKPPVRFSQQLSYKRQLNLHFAVIIVAVAAIFLKTFIPALAGEETTALAFKVFLMLVTGVIVSLFVEIVYAIGEGTVEKFYSYKSYVDPINTGLLIALILPSITPIYVLVLAVIVGVFAGKLVYGGYGFYIFNPVLVGALFVMLSFSTQLEVFGTPLQALKDAMVGITTEIDFWPLIVGNYEAIAIGSAGLIILLLAFIYLCVTRVVDLRISGVFLLAISLISFIIGYFNGFVFDYILLNLITGLTMFGAVFLISESVSSPTSRETKIIYATVVAVLTMMVRVLGTYNEGVIFAILFGNMLTPFINRTVKRSNNKTLIKTVVFSVLAVVSVGVILGLILHNRIEEANAFVGGVLL